MTQRKSDVPIVVRKWGNAHGAQGGTYGRPFDGNVNHTQRWTHDDHGSRTDSQSGSSALSAADPDSVNDRMKRPYTNICVMKCKVLQGIVDK